MYCLDVFIEFHVRICTTLLKDMPYHGLLFWRKKNGTLPIFKIFITAKLAGKCRHELIILNRVHLLPESGKSFCKPLWLATGIMRAFLIPGATVWIYQPNNLSQSLPLSVHQLMQACLCHRAIIVHANRIICRNVTKCFGNLRHSICQLKVFTDKYTTQIDFFQIVMTYQYRHLPE